MFGELTGELKLFQLWQVDDDFSELNLLMKISGNQGKEWHQAYVQLRKVNSSYQLVFEATLGVGYFHSIALDKFSLSQDKTNCQLLKASIEAKYQAVDHGRYLKYK